MAVEIDLATKVIVITGFRGCLGTEIATWADKAGATVVGLDRPSSSTDVELGNFIPVDVTDAAAVTQAFARIVEKFGPIHGLVNCAGVTSDAPMLDMTPEQFDFVVSVNQRGTFLCMQAAARLMRDQGLGGSIINFSSISRKGNRSQINYAGTKAAVDAMTRTAALELGRYGIRVNAVAPGPVDDTDMVGKVPTKIVQKWIGATPSGSLTTTEEIAKEVLHLLSDWASGITGEVVTVSRGLTF